MLFRASFSLFQRRLFSNNIYSDLSLTTLLNHGFSEIESRKILNILNPFLNLKIHETIDSSLKCWKKNVLPKKQHNHLEIQKLFNEVFTEKESRLLLVDEDFINDRIDNIKKLDLVRGQNDIWRAFHKAPAGFFLQDWKEFLKKYYYITFKILPWLAINHETDKMNPLMEYPNIIEQSYESIKVRFLFAHRTGFKVAENRNMNLSTLLLIPPKDFIDIYAPHCTMEEFNALEILNESEIGQEDDKLFEDLVELSSTKSSTSKHEKDFLRDTIKEGILLSSLK